MDKILKSALLAAFLVLAPAAHAQSDEEVVRSKCSRCHALSVEKDGPALKAIAAKYKGSKDAEAKVVALFKDLRTHAKVQASEEQLKAAARFVLRQ